MPQVVIETLNHQGDGVAHWEGRGITVAGALPGEQVEVELPQSARSSAARLLRLVACQSVDRIVSECPHYGAPDGCSGKFACGGCRYQHLSYERELSFKHLLIMDCFKKHGLPTEVIAPVRGGRESNYRNKMTLHVGICDGQVGFTLRDRIFPAKFGMVPSCQLAEDLLQSLIAQINAVLEKWVTPQEVARYRQQEGWLRAIQVRTIPTVEPNPIFLVNIAITQKDNPKISPFVERLLKLDIAEISVSLSEPKLDKLYWQSQRASDAKLYRVSMGDRLGWCGPMSFLQVNTRMAQQVYDFVAGIPFSKRSLCLDAYCGVGLLTLGLSDKFESIIGVESDEVAVRCGCRAAAEQQRKRCHFILQDTGKFLTIWDKVAHGTPKGRRKLLSKSRIPDLEGSAIDCLILDPPRSGCAPNVVKSIKSLLPNEIVYISCAPDTLARDLAGIIKSGYSIEKVQPFDLFPRTAHIETVVHLTR